jgi:hypothetical protein
MKSLAFTVVALLASALVNAQIYQWKDVNGKTIISDHPPVGTVSDPRKIEAKAAASSDLPPKLPADQEMDFRKRQQALQEKSNEAKKIESIAAQQKENCERIRRNLALLESGERIAQRDDRGERSFMDDAQREQEIAKALQTLQSSCNK